MVGGLLGALRVGPEWLWGPPRRATPGTLGGPWRLGARVYWAPKLARHGGLGGAWRWVGPPSKQGCWWVAPMHKAGGVCTR